MARRVSSTSAAAGLAAPRLSVSTLGPAVQAPWRTQRLLLTVLLACMTCVLLVREGQRRYTAQATVADAHATSTAVVVPFVWCQLELRLVQNFEAWKAKPPCDPDNPALLDALGQLSLVFHFNRDLDSVLELDGRSGKPALTQLWDSLGALQRCFAGGVHYLSANLTDEQNSYPLGTCIQFYGAFPLLRGLGFDHWFQMEPDVLPLRAGWGARVAELAAQNADCQNFWQAGSLPMYANSHDFHPRIDNGTTVDQHLNGNSLYCLADARFGAYLTRVQQATPHGCGGRTAAGWPLFGFDYAMYRFRAEPTHQAYARTVRHKFIATGFIINIARLRLNTSDLALSYPDMLLVHTQSHYNDSRQMAVCRKRERTLRRNSNTALGSEQAAVPLVDTPAACEHAVFAEAFRDEGAAKTYDITGGAQMLNLNDTLVPPTMLLTSIFPGDIGHVEFSAIYSKEHLCRGHSCDIAAFFNVSVRKPEEMTRVADGMAFAFVDAAKQTSGATAFLPVSGVLVPVDALSLVLDEYDNGDGAGFLLVSSFAGRAVVLARKAGIPAEIMAGEQLQVQIVITARNTITVQAGSAVVFQDEHAHLPATFFLLASANSGDFSSSHLLHSVHLCRTAGVGETQPA
jgi:hypothetical protein